MDRRTFMIGAGSVAGIALLPRWRRRRPIASTGTRAPTRTSSTSGPTSSSRSSRRQTPASPSTWSTPVMVPVSLRSPSARLRQCRPRPIRMPTSSRSTIRAFRRARSRPGCSSTSRRRGCRTTPRLNPLTYDSDFSLPLRGSQVLIGYDSTKLEPEDAPKTWPELVAWIKANPGAVHLQPSRQGRFGRQLRPARHLSRRTARTRASSRSITSRRKRRRRCSTRRWEILKDLAPYTMDKGAYTSGNTQSIQLLSQSAVTMIAAWSDQALSAIEQGVLPETTGLRAARRPRAFRRLRAHGRADQRGQPRSDAEALRLRPERRNPVGGGHRAGRLPRRSSGNICRPRCRTSSSR